MKNNYVLFFTFFMLSFFTYGQGLTCDQAEPFCASNTAGLVFPNTSGGVSAEAGPDYGCLATQPNPAWYFLQVGQSGNISIEISQNEQQDFSGIGLDVDFICYGPFTSTNNCGNLTAANIVSCSYSVNFVENFTIAGATSGDIYILLITNYQDQPGFISLNQTDYGQVGAGDTDCSIVNTINYCEGDVVSLDGTDAGAVSYVWYQDGVLMPTETGPILNNVMAPSATYTVEKFNSLGGLIVAEVFNAIFHIVPVANVVTEYQLCDDNTADGFTQFDLTTKDAEVIGAQTDVSVSYYGSPGEADSGFGALSNLYTNTSNSQTIYARIENNNNPDCFDTAAFDLTVLPSPTATVPGDMFACDDVSNDGTESFDLTSQTSTIIGSQTDVSVSYHTSLADAEASALPLTSPYNSASQTIYVRVEDDNNGCFSTTSFQVIVNDLPIANQPLDLEVCDDASNDGVEPFDLTSQTATVLGTQLASDFTVTYHETIASINDDSSLITTPASFNGSSQTIYVRIENNNDATCFDTTSFTLTVNTLPEATQPSNIIVCDDLSNDGTEIFDLTIQATTIIGVQLPTDVAVTYHESQIDAETDLAAIGNPGSYSSANRTIHVRVESTISDVCYAYTSFELIVNPLPSVIVSTPYNLCDDNSDGFENFMLTDKIPEILNGQSGVTVTFYTNLPDAQSESSALTMPYTNVAASETLYVRLENDVTGCYNTTTLDINVYPLPTTQSPLPIEVCDIFSNGEGVEFFDLTIREADITGGALDVTTTYYENFSDAEAGTGNIPDPTMFFSASSQQTIFVRVTNNISGCYDNVELDLVVLPFIAVIAVPNMIECELNTDGLFAFDLDSKTDEVLNGQDPTIFTVTYHETLAEAQAGSGALVSPYTNINNNPQEIFVNITNTVTGCSISTVSFFIEVQESAVANMPANDYVICDYLNDNDGIAQFDLTTQDAEVLGPTQTTGYSVTYYDSLADAEAGVDQIPTLYENLTNPQIIYARVDNDNTSCYATTELTLRVELRPIFNLDSIYYLCADGPNGVVTTVSPPAIDTGLNSTNYSFVWTEQSDSTTVLGSDSFYVPSQAGNYEVLVTNLATGCEETGSTEVLPSSPPDVVATVNTLAFADTHIIEVSATGDGEYEFSLDGGPWVSNSPNTNSYIFTDVSLGEHTVFARDINGCGESSDTVLIMDYPLYFTPNGDGFNETWQIPGISNQPDAVIYIFDRYGKLLKQLSPTGPGWDGTFNGEPLPSTDYWFVVDYREPVDDVRKEFKAHFTLKR